MSQLVSVIIPTYNSARTIALAIKSILAQTYPDIEIIIVNDNSSDNTNQVIEKFVKKDSRVKYYSLPYDDPKRFNIWGVNINAGWLARNYGIEKAKGDWITFQDADDASLVNRIEVQYQMAKKYKSSHVCIDWQKFDKEYLGKSLDVERILKQENNIIIPKEEILKLVNKTKGYLFPILGKKHKYIPFLIKKRKLLSHLFFKSWTPYPYAGNCSLIKRKIIKKVKFRPLAERIWPSKRGRGADRDFNFQAAETFENSICVKLPLYLWRVKTQNPAYSDCYLKEYIK